MIIIVILITYNKRVCQALLNGTSILIVSSILMKLLTFKAWLYPVRPLRGSLFLGENSNLNNFWFRWVVITQQVVTYSTNQRLYLHIRLITWIYLNIVLWINKLHGCCFIGWIHQTKELSMKSVDTHILLYYFPSN